MAALYFGGVAGPAAFLLALAVGGTVWRTAGVLAVGITLALIWLLVAYVAAPPASDKSPGCNECYVYLGRWWEPGFAVFIIGLNLVAWWIGGLIGSAVRAAAGSRT